MANLFSDILSIVLSVILIASVVVPVIKEQNTTGWTTAETTYNHRAKVLDKSSVRFGFLSSNFRPYIWSSLSFRDALGFLLAKQGKIGRIYNDGLKKQPTMFF